MLLPPPHTHTYTHPPIHPHGPGWSWIKLVIGLYFLDTFTGLLLGKQLIRNRIDNCVSSLNVSFMNCTEGEADRDRQKERDSDRDRQTDA